MIKCNQCAVLQGERDCGRTKKGYPASNFFKKNSLWYCEGCLMDSEKEGYW